MVNCGAGHNLWDIKGHPFILDFRCYFRFYLDFIWILF